MVVACVGKSCGKYNGKARSVATLGLLPCEWNLPLCWRSGGSHFFFVVSSAMMTCTTMERNEEMDWLQTLAIKQEFWSLDFSFVLFSERIFKGCFSFFLSFFVPFFLERWKLCSSKTRDFEVQIFALHQDQHPATLNFFLLRWMRIYYKKSQNNIWTTNMNYNNKSKSTKELQSKQLQSSNQLDFRAPKILANKFHLLHNSTFQVSA